jgi:hypothetical protein
MFQVNKSQENWTDAQLSLSTATPSLGGAPPKLTTLKIDYYRPSYNHYQLNDFDENDYDRAIECRRVACVQASPIRLKKLRGFPSFRARSSLNSKPIAEEKELNTENIVNVLSTTTEASMSSSSFSIPRRSTIDADVSFDCSNYLKLIISSHRVNHTKSQSLFLISVPNLFIQLYQNYLFMLFSKHQQQIHQINNSLLDQHQFLWTIILLHIVQLIMFVWGIHSIFP